MDCKLGVRTASNAYNENNYEFYLCYKSDILVDAISGLPNAVTTTANIIDGEIAIPFLKSTNLWFSLGETFFFADKGYDIIDIYKFERVDFHSQCFIPPNKKGSFQQ